MATIQEHAMILKATRNGVSEERIARVLKVDVASIRQKRDLLNGICKEAAEILKNKHVSLGAFSFLRKMKPMRQTEVADKHKVVESLTPEQVAKMEKEMEALQRDLKIVEDSHGNQVLNLVLVRGYLLKLFANSRIIRYLGQHHPDILRELQAICEGSSPEN
jgi:hypothetical protein